MAYVRKPEEEAGADSAAPTTGPSQGEVLTAGGGGEAPTAPKMSEPAKPGTTGSGMFDNVGRYLDVNKDKAAGLANRVGGVITGDINKANEAVTSAQSQFNKDVDASTVKYNQGLITDATKNAQAYANDAAKKAAVQGQYNATYGGPTDLANQKYYQDTLSSVNNAKSAANLAGTEAGRKELLARGNTGRASGGVQSLNNAILQNSDDAQNIIANSAKGASSLDQRLADAAKASSFYASQGQATTAATRTAAQKAFADTYGQFQSDLSNKATSAQKSAQASANEALTAFNSGAKLSPTQLSLLGISQKDADSFRGQVGEYQSAVDAAKARDAKYAGDRDMFSNLGGLTDERGAYGLVGAGDGQFNLSNAASADDYARLAALNSLSGRGDNFIDPKQAGSAPNDLLDFRYGDLQSRLAKAIADANAVKGPAFEDTLPGAVDRGGKTAGGLLGIEGILAGLQGAGDKISSVLKDAVNKGQTFVDDPLGTTVATGKKAIADTTSATKKAGRDVASETKKATSKIDPLDDAVLNAGKGAGGRAAQASQAAINQSLAARNAANSGFSNISDYLAARDPGKALKSIFG